LIEILKNNLPEPTDAARVWSGAYPTLDRLPQKNEEKSAAQSSLESILALPPLTDYLK
jgi:hypothetical protein